MANLSKNICSDSAEQNHLPVHIRIRPARSDDAPGIRAIMAWFIDHTTSNWRYKPMDLQQTEQWLQTHLTRPVYQVWVAEAPDGLIGYSCLSEFRVHEGYWPCAENSVYVLPEYAGLGLGSALMQKILDQARANSLQTIIAAIDSENQNSIRFHQRFGFCRSGYLKRVGWKMNHWLDLVLMTYAVPQKDSDAKEGITEES